MSRIPLVPDADAPPVVQEIYATAARFGPVPELYRVLAQSPDVLAAWTQFAWPLRMIKSTSRALRELLILRIAQLTGADYEWHHHVPMATAVGVSPEQIDELAQWETSSLFSDTERAVLRYVEAVVGSGDVDERAFTELADEVGPTSVVDITVTAAWYLAVSRVVSALGPFSD